MRIYEELFIVDPDASEEEIDSLVGQVEGVVKDADGAIDKVDKWGKRKLAYRIKKHEEGYYVLIQFSSDAEAVKEIERQFRVNDLVLKYITVRIDEKLKWLEKRKKAREKRAQRKPATAAPAPKKPSEPGATVPGAPAPAKEEQEQKEEQKQEQGDKKPWRNPEVADRSALPNVLRAATRRSSPESSTSGGRRSAGSASRRLTTSTTRM